MKKTSYLFLGLGLVLSLTACGETKIAPPQAITPTTNPVTEQPAEPATTETKTPASNTPATEVATTEVKTYSLADVAKHASAGDCWQAIDGRVYDVTSYVTKHPGGPAIIKGCGKEATEMFNAIEKHAKVKDKLPQFLIGDLK